MAQTKDGALKIAASKAGLDVAEYSAKVTAGEKRCFRCGCWKIADAAFGKDRTRYDGRDACCFECRRVKEPRTRKGQPSSFLGRTHSEEAKRLMSQARRGKPAPHKAGPRPLEFRAKVSASLRASSKVKRGQECHSYKDGKMTERRGQRLSQEYKRWRFDVFCRDSFTCQKCGDSTGGNLNAHHVKPFANFPELRFDIKNGITLCEKCHSLKHSTQ